MATKLWVGTDAGNEGDLNVADNWSPSGVPSAGDHVWFIDSAQDVTASLTTFAAVALGSAHFARTFTGIIDGGDMGLGETVVTIGEHYGTGRPAGSGRLTLDMQSAGSTVNVLWTPNTPDSDDEYQMPVRLRMNHAAAVLNVLAGYVGLEIEPGDAGQVASVNVGQGEAVVHLGSGLTLATLLKYGGSVVQECGATTVRNLGGELLIRGAGAIATLGVDGGLVLPESSGTITALNARGGSVDMTRSPTARTVTTLLIDGGVVAYDPNVVTVTNALTSNRRLQIAAA